jgi:hypothetical protein
MRQRQPDPPQSSGRLESVRELSRPQPPRKKPGHGATYSVIVMTIAALVGVAVLAAQAAATAPKVSNGAGQNSGKVSPQPTGSTSTGSSAAGAADPTALPANSGSGARVVYGVAAKRVWLVSSANAVIRTFTIVPGTVPAPAGSYNVTNKLSSVMGTDETPVQYVVLFGKVSVNGSSTALGFDAVANITGMPPAPTARTAAVRMAQADAQALWSFSSVGTRVVVMA